MGAGVLGVVLGGRVARLTDTVRSREVEEGFWRGSERPGLREDRQVGYPPCL
jgi:hypothetical protein